jgi:hypothetical protein
LQLYCTLGNPLRIANHPHATSIDLMRRYFLTSRRVAWLTSLVLIESALQRQYDLFLEWKLHRIVVGRADIRLCKEAGNLAMRFVLAA